MCEVIVKSARNLLAADEGGTSDPFAVLNFTDATGEPISLLDAGERGSRFRKKSKSLSPTKAKTKIVKKTTNPEWNEAFQFGTPPDQSFLLVQVFDDDLLGKDSLGEVEISLDKVDHGRTVQGWYSLSATKKMKASNRTLGEIYLVISVCEVGESIDDMRSRLFEERVTRWKEQATTNELGEPNELHVGLLRAEGLPAMDRTMFSSRGTSDPMAKISIEGQSKVSTIKKKTLNPVWLEEFIFEVESTESCLEIEIEDWDLTSSNDFIGKVVIPMHQLADKNEPNDQGYFVRQWFNLKTKPKSKVLDVGRVELALFWTHNETLHPKFFTEQEVHPTELPNELLVAVCRARNLIAMDSKLFGRGDATSDPLVKLQCGNEKAKTTVIKKSLRPTWNEIFSLDVRASNETKGDSLRVVVEDWDVTSNDFMGFTTVDTESLKDQQLHRSWYKLLGKQGTEDKPRGELELVMRWVFNPARDLSHFVGDDDDHPNEPPNELRVAIIQAKGLPIMDSNIFGKGGSSDPLARLSVGSQQEKRTRTIKKCLEPLWNEEFTFEVRNEEQSLSVVVEDWDQFSGNDFIGAVVIPLHTLANKQARTTWYPLKSLASANEPNPQPVNEKSRGQIEIALHWWFNPTLHKEFFTEYDEDEFPERLPNQLLVAVTRAEGLLAMDRKLFSSGKGSSDPQVKLRCTQDLRGSVQPIPFAGEWKRSEVMKKTLEPVWNTEFQFNVDAADPTLGDCFLEIVLEDWDMLGNDFLGQSTINLMPAKNKENYRKWCKLLNQADENDKDRGSVELVYRWIYNPSLEQSLLESEEFCDDAHRDQPPNELCVALIRARDLVAMDRASVLRSMFSASKGTSDPLAIITCETTQERSTVKKKTLTPVWNEVFRFPVSNPRAMLDLILEDVDLGTQNDFMGKISIPLKHFEDHQVQRKWYALEGKSPETESDQTRGHIELAIKWIHNPNLNPKFFLDDTDDPKYAHRPPNELKVAVVRASSLKPGSGGASSILLGGKRGKSDPYAILRLGSTLVQTKVQRRTLAPNWMETFTLPENNLDAELEVSVMDWDMGPTRNHQLLGRALIPIEVLSDKVVDQSWHTLGGSDGAEDGESRGEIELAFHWWFNPSLEPDFFTDVVDDSDREPNNLLVAVIQAMQLPATKRVMGREGSIAPFVSIRSSGSDVVIDKTPIKKKQQNPVWNFTTSVPIEDPDGSLTLQIENWSFLGVKLIGLVEVPLAQLHDKHTERAWFSITGVQNSDDAGSSEEEASSPKAMNNFRLGHKVPANESNLGSLELAFKWVFEPSLSVNFFTEEEEHPERELNEFCVAVVQARGLKPMDRKLFENGSADTFALVKIGDHSERTNVIKNSLSPKWHAQYTFPLQEEQGVAIELLEVSLYDSDSTSNEHIGTVRIPLAGFGNTRTLERHWYELGDDMGESDGRLRGRVELCIRWRYNMVLDPVHQASLPRWEWEQPELSAKEQRGVILRESAKTFHISEQSEELNLRRSNMQTKDAYLLSAFLSLDRIQLRKLDLREAHLSAEQVRVIAQGLSTTQYIEELNLSRNVMPDSKLSLGRKAVKVSVKEVSSMLARNACLRSLDLSEVKMEPLSLATIADGLCQTLSLQVLKLSFNFLCNVNQFGWGKFQVEGVMALADSLKTALSLEVLELKEVQLCGLSRANKGSYRAQGLVCLAQGILANRTLKYIDLTGNRILEEGGKPIILDIASSGPFDLLEKKDGRAGALVLKRIHSHSTCQRRELPFLELFQSPSTRSQQSRVSK